MGVYQRVFLPKSYFVIFYLHYILLKFYSYFVPKPDYRHTKIVLSAGCRGWESIEFKELYKSACEYLDRDSVIIHSLENSDYYIDLKTLLKQSNCTHILYDPRTGEQNFYSGIWEVIKISYLLVSKNVTPIVLSTDLSFRIWRIKSALLSAISGIVICFVSPRKIHPIFPHNRLFGPFLMPFSLNTFYELANLKLDNCSNSTKSAVFIGSLYEPRTTLLNKIKYGLNEKGLDLEVRGRELGGVRKPDIEYWSTFVNSEIIITTADQVNLPGMDWTWVQNLVYRYIEALASGTLLVAPEVSGVDKYFDAGIHFVSFNDSQDAIEKIIYYSNNKMQRETIAKNGKMKAKALIESRIFWTLIDSNLGSKSLK